MLFLKIRWHNPPVYTINATGRIPPPIYSLRRIQTCFLLKQRVHEMPILLITGDWYQVIGGQVVDERSFDLQPERSHWCSVVPEPMVCFRWQSINSLQLIWIVLCYKKALRAKLLTSVGLPLQWETENVKESGGFISYADFKTTFIKI